MAGEAFSCIDQVGQCMADEIRSSAFQRAIEAVVRPGMKVLDVGTGTGLLAMFAARAGAKSVVAIEYDPFVASVASENFAKNGFADKIDLRVDDATSAKFNANESFDVVVMELLTTGLIDELQIAATTNLHRRQVVNEKTIFVPYNVQTFAAPVEMEYAVCGLEMKMVRHLWLDFPDRPRAKPLAKSELIDSTSFNKMPTQGVDVNLDFQVKKAGIVNGLYLSSQTNLSPGNAILDTLTLNAPVVIPMQDIEVKSGDVLRCRLAYSFGEGYPAVKACIVEHLSRRLMAA